MKISRSRFKNIIAYLLITTILFQFLRNVTSIYFLFLGSLVLLTIIIIIFPKFNKIKLTTIYKIKLTDVNYRYLIFMISLLYIVFLSTINLNKYELSIMQFIVANSKMWIMPLVPFFLYYLISSKEKITYVINIYILFILAASLSIYLQQFLGSGFDFFSVSYNKMRMGHENNVTGYASLTGNVTTYGASFYSAIILIFFNKFNYPFLKAFFIALIMGAAVITMSKTGLLMSIITAMVIFFLSIKFNKLKFLFYLFIIVLFGSIIFYNYFVAAFITMFVNTFGIEVANINISTTTQWQAFIPRVTDRVFGVFFINTISNYTVGEIIFGIGMLGAGGLLGFNSGTSHNTFFDIYLMGGFISLLAFLYLFFFTQLKLYKLYKKSKDQLLIAFFISNSLLFIILNVFNGAIFHPAIGMPFWISIIYLMLYSKDKIIN